MSAKIQHYFTFLILCIVTTAMGQERLGGLALYTVRDDMAKDALATLEAVAATGYSYVEAAGYDKGKYYGMAPEKFKETIAALKLQPISTHQSSITLTNAEEQFSAAKQVGFTYFVIPIPPMGMFTYDRTSRTMGMKGTVQDLTKILNELGEKASANGLQLLYHNHDFEFKPNEDGIIPMDYLLENTNPEYVNFEIDLFWAVKAGVDPVAYFEKYPGRFKAWHVKDMSDEGQFAPVGEGLIDFSQILTHKETAGMQYYFVEQDMTFDRTPMEAIKISHSGLKEIGFN
ncbi:MAG: sugar phosphate isomerase/epimerase [Bacteroidota bacterium]